MKKAGFVLCVCLVSLAVLLCACQTLKDLDDARSTTTVPTENTQGAPKENAQTTNKLATSEWKTAYLDFIESNKNAYRSYMLVFVDNDDVPELYLSGVDEATGDRICSYKNGTVMETYMNRTGGGKYVERGGSIINQNGHMGRCYTTVYKLDENGFTKTLSALSTEHVEHLGGEEYKISYEYSIEGQPVSEDEYNAAINAAFDFSKGIDFYETAVSYDEIKQQITGNDYTYGK